MGILFAVGELVIMDKPGVWCAVYAWGKDHSHA